MKYNEQHNAIGNLLFETAKMLELKNGLSKEESVKEAIKMIKNAC